MSKAIQVIALWLVLALCVSCSDDTNPVAAKDINGSGNPTTETRSLPMFHAVDFRTAGQVEITSGSQQEVKVTVDDNLLQYLRTSVNGGELVITFDSAVDPENFELLVELTMTDLSNLTLSGAGSIIGQNAFDIDVVDFDLLGAGTINMNVQADNLRTSLPGAGSVVLAGHSRRHTCTHSGVGTLDAYAMDTDTTIVSLSGVGNAQVFVSDYLDATVSGVGSVYYRGQPHIDETITGFGDVYDDN